MSTSSTLIPSKAASSSMFSSSDGSPSVVSRASSRIADTFKVGFDAANEKVGRGNIWITLAVIVIIMIVFALVIVYIIKIVKNNGTEEIVLHKELIALADRNIVPMKIVDGVPSVNGGQSFSITFWIYITDSYDITSNHKLVFQRGNGKPNTDSFTSTTNPIVFMHKATNKMYIAVATKNASDDITLDQLTADKNATYVSGYMISKIDYVPFQRWVNIGITIQDYMISIYYDGQLYSVVSTGDVSESLFGTGKGRPMINGCSGDFYLGDSSNLFKGYIAKTSFYNYAISPTDIENLYKIGPSIKTWLSYLGLGNYGVRTPVYKLSE